jgi:hypothetical protein
MYSKRVSLTRSAGISTARLPRSHAPSPIECLESRIVPAALLFGIGTGLHKTVVHLIDSTGDEVDVSISGHGFFNITLDGQKQNHADIDNISIEGATAGSRLTVSVESREMGGGLFPTVTPGATNVNSITSDYTGAMKGIWLRSVSVQDIDLGTVGLSGGLVLDVTNASRADHINESAMHASGSQYTPVAPGIDLNAVTLASAGTIAIRGQMVPVGDGGTNDFDGAIDVTGALNHLVGANSTLYGSVNAGTLGGVMVGQLEGSLNSTGDMTLDLKSVDSNVTVTVGGNLNLRLGYSSGNVSYESGLFGSITVGGDVSGLAPGNTDPIMVRGDFTGSLNATGDIASLAIVAGSGTTKGMFTGTLGSAGNIGDVSAQGGFTGHTDDGGNSFSSVSANGSIGNISSQGTNSGTFSAGGNIGNISSIVNGHAADAISGATFDAQGSIGSILAQSFNGAAIRSTSIHSIAGDVGDTMAIVTNLTGSDAITGATYGAAFGTVGNVTAMSAGGNGISDLSISANSVLSISGTAGISSSGDGIQQSTVVANSSIGDVTGTAMGVNGANGINTLSLQVNGVFFNDNILSQESNRASIGDIHGVTAGVGNGIIGLTTVSSGGIHSVLGEATSSQGASGIASSNVNASGSIGGITGTTQGTGSGITDLTAATQGSIDGIVGSAFVEFGNHGIANTTVTARFGITSITGTSGGLSGASGIINSGFTADLIGDVIANAYGQGESHGIDGTSFTAGSIGNITANSNFGGAEAIANAHFNSSQVGLITVQSSGDTDHSIVGSTIGTDSPFFNYGGVVSDRSVDLAFDTTGGQGTIGTISIGGNFDAAALSGVTNLGHFSVAGSVQGLVGNGAVNSTMGDTITVGDELDSSVTFNYANYLGTPNGMIAGVSQAAGYNSGMVDIVGGGV